MKRKLSSLKCFIALGSLLICLMPFVQAQHSVARQWNEVLLEGIRKDYARPTVHSRNLFHTSIAMYDAWAAYDAEAQPYLLGNIVHGFFLPWDKLPVPADVKAAREEAISYAAYRILSYRFRNSPGAVYTLGLCDSLMYALGYDAAMISTDYRSGDPAALGNYIAEGIITYGLQDGSNEQGNYNNQYYLPVNPPMVMSKSGNPTLSDPNHWQPLAFSVFIDQSGNPIPGNVPAFLGPEWGNVRPFSLTEEDRQVYQRDGNEYWVYHDPGPPPHVEADGSGNTAEYQWNFTLVSWWSSHLDPADSVMWDVSPASIGKVDDLPTTLEGLHDFYKEFEGGDPGTGYDVNPYTGQPYEPQWVPRADYARVLAEFWADGPDSETPPGHWFTILNYVNDHPAFVKRFEGQGDIMDALEWDVKAYFLMGGTMHDCAVTAWGIKGYYDYIRPVSAIRWMAEMGQCTDPSIARYSPEGIPLMEGLVEMVKEGDPLAGDFKQHVNKVKLFAWRGPDFIDSPAVDVAGVGWILAENWWPYQRPTFVTPPFAGYVSGHSTFSRAAAELMTLLTGDAFFPGGMSEFVAKKNEFLVFEEGPSMDVPLQWATYRDASDQTSLSRIWGGIHPPADDIPGRIIGEEIGVEAFEFAKTYFKGEHPDAPLSETSFAYPNPVSNGGTLSIALQKATNTAEAILVNTQGQKVYQTVFEVNGSFTFFQMPIDGMASGLYMLFVKGEGWEAVQKIVVK